MNERTYSYHVFYFPFKWELPGEEEKPFSEQIDLAHIPIVPQSLWERGQYDPKEEVSFDEKDIQERKELFGELQYYFDFVHPVLYDIKGMKNSIIHHYERREPKDGSVEYRIAVKNKEYVLRVDAMNLNLYATGVGILMFFLANNRKNQSDESSVRDINQFGRRIMPPHAGEFESRGMMSKSITIAGLHGDASRYLDTFDYCIHTHESTTRRGLSDTWHPAIFIESLIEDLSPCMKVTPVIDDRMLVNCWFGDNELSQQVEEDKEDKFLMGDFWYKYVFVDDGKDDTCKNQTMKRQLLEKSTYYRWQECGTLYGVTRYSMVALTNASAFDFIGMHIRTIYSRMFELIIVQRASVLRFSSEVTKVSRLSRQANQQLAERISSLYQEYIRFVNQIYFQSVTAQDQGIEIYNMLLQQFDCSEKIKELESEIGELHQYITLYFDEKRNQNGEWLNELATLFLPATIITGIFGMNPFNGDFDVVHMGGQIVLIWFVSIWIYLKIKKRRGK